MDAGTVAVATMGRQEARCQEWSLLFLDSQAFQGRREMYQGLEDTGRP